MAKKSKAPQPDENGVIDNGIVRKWIAPRNRSKYDPPPKAPDEFRRRLTIEDAVAEGVEFLKQFTEGPHEWNAMPGVYKYHIYHPEFGNGELEYTLKEDAPPKCNDYIELLTNWWLYQKHSKDDGKRDMLNLLLLTMGQLVERLRHVRPFESAAAIGKERIENAANMRDAKKSADLERRLEKHQLAIEAMAWARKQFPTAALDDSVNFLKKKAAGHLEKSRATLDRWLKYGGK